MRKLPIGIQGFEGLRKDGYVYVDKTEYIYQLVHTGKEYFLSRPRRFGKSLLLSAIRAYWEGKRQLFEGLRIAELEADNQDAWAEYPVFLFDFNGQNYQKNTALEIALDVQLKRWEAAYGLDGKNASLGERFQNLMIAANQKTGRRCVVLVDEYDKPLLETMEQPELEEQNKAVFKGFFSSLKGFDEYIQFVFITGVTKFEKVSIFSDLNQLRDISFNRDFADICGITEKELEAYFPEEVKQLAASQTITEDACLAQLKETYDGYRFHPQAEGVYNPFSLLNAFADKDFRAYWFATGTPTFLVRKLKASGFDIRRLSDRTLYASEAQMSDYRADNPDPVPLLYQTGYLTIAAYDKERKRYTLAFPNEEVKYGMLESLMPAFIPNTVNGTGTDIFTLDDYIENGNIDGIHNVLTALFAGIPYTQERNPFEHYFQTVIYLVFALLGKFTACEMHTAAGRVDCIVKTGKYIYLFEFKRDGTTKEALEQIEEKGYALPFSADKRKLYRIGVTFDSETRMLNGWEVRE